MSGCIAIFDIERKGILINITGSEGLIESRILFCRDGSRISGNGIVIHGGDADRYCFIKHNSAIRDVLKYTQGTQVGSVENISALMDGLNIMKYDVTYENDSGVTTRILPKNKVILLARSGPNGAPVGHTLQGPAKANNFVPGRFSKSWDTEDPDDTWLMVGHYMVPAIEYPDWIIVITAY